MQGSKKHIITTIAWIALFAIVQHIFTNTFWLHTHVTTDGNTYIHAHPFDKSTDNAPVKSHQHSKTDYFVLDQSGFLLAIISLSILLFLFRKYKKLPVFAPIYIKEFLLLTRPGRAPPLSV